MSDDQQVPDQSGQSTLDINAAKVEIILRLHDQFRGHINFWHDQMFRAATWSILPAYALIPYYVQDPSAIAWWVVAVLVFLIGVVSAVYLTLCHRAWTNNWQQIINCQFALRLQERGEYFVGQPFFGGQSNARPDPDSPEWKRHVGLHAGDMKFVRAAHGVAILAALGVMVALWFAMPLPGR